MPKFDLTISPPLMNAAGTLGFAPDRYGPVDFSRFGAFVTNPISPEPRIPAHGTRFLPFSGGFLLHTGYPNPGMKSILRRCADQWARSPLPVIVHLLARSVDGIAAMVRSLELTEGVSAFEVGLPPGVDAASAVALTRAALGELPIIVRLPMEQAAMLGPRLIEEGASAVSLEPPRGALLDSAGTIIHGRLYGPALFPLALETVRAAARQGVTVIGAGGVYQPEQVETMLTAGAAAVQLDAALWRRPEG